MTSLKLHTFLLLRNTWGWGGEVLLLLLLPLFVETLLPTPRPSCTCTHGRCYAELTSLNLPTRSGKLRVAHMIVFPRFFFWRTCHVYSCSTKEIESFKIRKKKT